MTTQPSTMAARPRTSDRANERADLRVPGVLLFLVGAAFLIVTMLAASMAPGYDFNGAAISDLGVGRTAVVFNSLLVAIGALNILGGYLLYRSHGRAWILVIYTLAGIGATGVGLLPLDTGAPHSLFALVGFVFLNLEALATGTILSGPMRLFSFLAGAVGLVFVALLGLGDTGNAAAFGAIGLGGTERMIVYPAMVWLLALGGYLMADRARPGAFAKPSTR